MTLLQLMQHEKDDLKRKIKSLEAYIENAPTIQMRISHSNGCTQFYFRNPSPAEGSGNKAGLNPKTAGKSKPEHVPETINKSKHKPKTGTKAGYYYANDAALAKVIAQRDYNKRLLKELRARYSVISRTLNTYNCTDPEKVILSFSPDRRSLIESSIASREEYIKQWLSEEYPKKLFGENTPEIYTMNGERVRSKSEKIIADTLFRYNIPYRYEYPLELSGFGIVHPDFMVMNPFTRVEYFWEHFGMMDDEKYNRDALKKIEAYEKNNILPGQELIITTETKTMTLNIRVLEIIMKRYLF